MTTRDFHGWRKVFGVVTPAINTCVQPEYEALRPRGVSNQLARIQGSDIPLRTNEDFVQVVEDLYGNLDTAIRQVALCRPDHLILGISALAVWGGSRASSEALKRRLSDTAGGLPVSLATDAIVEALQAYGVKKRIAIVEPYFPVIQPRIESFFAECGYEVVRFNHMQGPKISEFTRTSAKDLITQLRSIDSPDVEALVQFGANLPMAAVADEAERWLGKPVIAVNIATYWHALRHGGIADRFDGHTRLLSDF
jgi:maleate isomerase